MSEDYLTKVAEYAQQALVQVGALVRCDKHNDILILNPDYEDGPSPYNLVRIWMEQYENDTPMRADIRDAVQKALLEASNRDCHQCSKLERFRITHDRTL